MACQLQTLQAPTNWYYAIKCGGDLFVEKACGKCPRFLAHTRSAQDGSVKLKLVINYGVNKGSIVAVGPASCFGSGNTNSSAQS